MKERREPWLGSILKLAPSSKHIELYVLRERGNEKRFLMTLDNLA
jgi:hypothetical protein